MMRLDVRVVGMTYYLPGLAEWLNGTARQVIARLSEEPAAGYSELLARAYAGSGARVADVFSAFDTSNFGDLGDGARDRRGRVQDHRPDLPARRRAELSRASRICGSMVRRVVGPSHMSMAPGSVHSKVGMRTQAHMQPMVVLCRCALRGRDTSSGAHQVSRPDARKSAPPALTPLLPEASFPLRRVRPSSWRTTRPSHDHAHLAQLRRCGHAHTSSCVSGLPTDHVATLRSRGSARSARPCPRHRKTVPTPIWVTSVRPGQVSIAAPVPGCQGLPGGAAPAVDNSAPARPSRHTGVAA
jgi:hypothetical protein